MLWRFLLFIWLIGFTLADAASFRVRTEEISFVNRDVTLNGTLYLPDRENIGAASPALVLVQGAGLGKRDHYRETAKAFAHAGVVALIYDKRTKGYSANGFGNRSYTLLAEDVLAAHQFLLRLPGVNQHLTGVWGLSEGAWVASLAATHSSEVAFLVLVGAAGMPPAQQESWHTENVLQHQGIHRSLVEAISRSMLRFLVTADLFPEGKYDPVPVFERLRQPVFAIWGANDITAVPAESAAILQRALTKAGNHAATLIFVPDANHDVQNSLDGYQSDGTFKLDYVQHVVKWLEQVEKGHRAALNMAALPTQERLSSPYVLQAHWYEAGGWLQLVIVLGMIGVFGGILLSPLIYRLRGREAVPQQFHRLVLAIAFFGLIDAIGLFPYLGHLMISGLQVESALWGRPVVWLGLQLASWLTIILSAVLLINLIARPLLRWKSLFLIVGIVLIFVPWSFYWRLLA